MSKIKSQPIKGMKRVPKPVFFVVALLILAFSFTAIFGISYYTGDNKTTVLKGISDIRWGIDIRGGVEATFKPAGDVDATDEQLESAKSIIELRMVSQGITDYELYADAKSDRIIGRKIPTRTQLRQSKRFLQQHSLLSVPERNIQQQMLIQTASMFTKLLRATQLRQSLWTVLMLKVQQQV